MAITKVKAGDILDLLRQLMVNGTPLVLDQDVNSILFSARSASGTTLADRRDVSDYALANGVLALGKVPIPLWDGRTDIGATDSVTVTDNTTDGKIDVTVADSGDPDATVTQELWMTKAGESTPFYLVAEFADGAHAVTPYTVNVADASLVRVHCGEDRSLTFGESTALLTPPTPSGALAGAGAGNCTDGTHLLAVVNKRHPDTETAQDVSFEIIVGDKVTGYETTFPEEGFETLRITEDI